VESVQKYKGNHRRLVRSVAAHVMAYVRICSYMVLKNAVNHRAVGFTANVARTVARNQPQPRR
jgi:hypothetical protein